jgi:HEAT repeat protein
VRAKAIEVLVKFGKDAEPALPKMHEVLRNVDPKLRIGAARAIVGVGSKKSVPGLESALKDKHPAVLAWAHAGLATLQGECPEHLRETAQILRDAPAEAASDIADAFERMRCKDPEVVPVLMEALSGEEQVKAAAARSLGAQGPAAAPAVPALIGALRDKSFLVRKAVLVAIPGIGSAAVGAVPAILPLLEDQAPRFRELAARALEGIGPGATQAIPALKKAALDSEPGVQAAAKRALAVIDKPIPDPEKEAPPPTGKPK